MIITGVICMVMYAIAGVTGYPLSVLKELVERSTVKIDTVLTYCRYSLNDTTLLNYVDFFKQRG